LAFRGDVRERERGTEREEEAIDIFTSVEVNSIQLIVLRSILWEY
jgi:hypothetical protein